jgi:hypothetical protein
MIFPVTRGYCNLVREADKLLVIFFSKKKGRQHVTHSIKKQTKKLKRA